MPISPMAITTSTGWRSTSLQPNRSRLMTRPYAPGHRIPTDLLLKAYASGVFPMAESASDPEVFWVRPETRGIIPLDAFHVPRSLAKSIRRGRFTVTFDADFEGV